MKEFDTVVELMFRESRPLPTTIYIHYPNSDAATRVAPAWDAPMKPKPELSGLFYEAKEGGGETPLGDYSATTVTDTEESYTEGEGEYWKIPGVNIFT